MDSTPNKESARPVQPADYANVVARGDAGISPVNTGEPQQNKARLIEIKQLDGGYIINVGCQTFAFETADKLLLKLGKYLANPAQAEKDYWAGRFDLK